MNSREINTYDTKKKCYVMAGLLDGGIFKKCGQSLNKVEFVKGLFKDTLPILSRVCGQIVLLHFDADFYQSAKDVLNNLLPLVVKKGFFIFHDYPGCRGVKKAVEEYFKPEEIILITPGSCYVQIE